MSDFETIIKIVAGLLILYVIIKVAAAIIAFFGYLTSLRDYLNSIPYANTVILIILAIIAGYYVFFR